MEPSIALRIRVAARFTVAMIVASLGAVIGSIGPGQGEADAAIGGVLLWLIALFVAFVIALEGVIQVIEQTVRWTLDERAARRRSDNP